MEVVNENTEVVVGKFYNVRCAEMKTDVGKVLYVPIIGHLHEDAQFGFPYKHYHIDGRFAKKGGYYNVDEFGKTNGVVVITGGFSGPAFIKVVRKNIKCKRLGTGVKPPFTATKYYDWYYSMRGKSCKGRKCPHLGTTMNLINGKLVCPLHDLIGCPVEEKII